MRDDPDGPGAAPHAPAVLDIEQGLVRLMGNTRIYFNALRRFGTHVEAASGLAAQLAAGDQAGAHRAVHTLKGAAGLLGADEVHALATRVEIAIDAGAASGPLLEELGSALQRLQARVDAVLADNPAVPPARALMAPDLPALLDRLARLFEDGDGSAIELVERWETVLEEELGAPAWGAVAAAAHDYDFELAAAALRDARSAGKG